MSETNDVMKRLHGIGIIPAIVLDDVKDAAPLAEALCKGGLPAAEVTFRTAAAHDAIKAMKEARPDLIVGAGTVLTKEQVDSALDAGAEFIVAPGLNPEIVKYCQEKKVPMVPGLSTASEIEQALALGLHTVKFFPAEAMGGVKTIKALCGPYKNLTFLPTGGINTENMLDYLNYDKIFAVGGTWMVKSDLIKNGQFDRIEEICHDAVLKMLGMHVKHVGLNVDSDEEGKKTADQFAELLLGKTRKTSKGYFGSELVEIMVNPHYGTHGHIGIGVNNVERALAYYRARGVEFDEDSITYSPNGDAKFAYFKEEIGGFKVHLVNN
jgi:2-dehydro-3-deoxyphosphogluconate aldolase/(4S)-4-hydroxy-2-oxoglutarate aldolase